MIKQSIFLCVLVSLVSCTHAPSGFNDTRDGIDDNNIRPHKIDTGSFFKIDDNGDVFVNSDAGKKIVHRNFDRSKWRDPFFLSPIVTGDGSEVAGWRMFSDDVYFVTDINMNSMLEVSNHYGLVKGAWGSSQTKGVLAVYQPAISGENCILIRDDKGVSCLPVGGKINTMTLYYDTEHVVLSISNVGVVVINRDTGVRKVIYSSDTSPMVWFGVFENRVLICELVLEDAGSDLLMVDLDGTLIKDFSVEGNSSELFVPLDQYGRWALLRGSGGSYTVIDIATGREFVSGEMAADKYSRLLTDVDSEGDGLLVEIVEPVGIGSPRPLQRIVFKLKEEE